MPWLQFAKGVVTGAYAGYEVFLGMVEAMVQKVEWTQVNKTMKNTKYLQAFNEVCNTLVLISPMAYKAFQHHFGGRGLQSLRVSSYPTPL
jgi:hypothetical protein